MKRQNKPILQQLFLVAIFCFLFYSLNPGINMFIFQLALIGIAYVSHPGLLRTNNGRMITAINLLSGLSVLMYGNLLSVFMVIGSGMLLSAYLSFSGATVFFTSFIGPLNLITSPFILVVRSFQSIAGGNKSGSRIVGPFIIIPAVVLLIFTLLYSSMSEGFRHFIIYDLPLIINVPRLIIVFIPGIIWVYFLYHFYWTPKSKKLQVLMQDESTRRERASFKGIERRTEYSMGIFLISLLLILLTTVLIADLYYIPVSSGMAHYQPEMIGENWHKVSGRFSGFSDDLHKATTSLILSILLSALIVQWFLRTKNDGSPQYNRLKWISAIWVGLNMVLIVYTFTKDLIYIENMGFSYLRIGVLIFLLLAMVGCILTLIRIFKEKNLWFLARHMAVAIMFTSVISSIIPWDGMITRANIKIAKDQGTQVDLDYLYSLRHPDYMAIYDHVAPTDPEKFHFVIHNTFSRYESRLHKFLGSNIMSIIEDKQLQEFKK